VTGSLETFALRRLNPFRGVVQVATSAAARALSHDGNCWEIQVRATRPEHWLNSKAGRTMPAPFLRFGVWTVEHGLQRGPTSVASGDPSLRAAALDLLQALTETRANLPFPLADRCELWLLDGDDRPFALLAAAKDTHEVDRRRPDSWAATALTEHRFRSQTLSALGVPMQDGHDPRVHAARLERLVRETAGRPPSYAWLLHQGAGDVRTLRLRANHPSAAHDYRAEDLPALPLAERWADRQAAGLAWDYLSWCAPYLLTLPDIGDAQRTRLEHAARARPLEVESQYRLYPKVVDRDLLNAIRVEARMRLAALA
jgi:hypothetical protein